MVEIEIPNGKIREMRRDDLPAISDMSGEDDVQRFYFVQKIVNLRLLWEQTLSSQERQIENGKDRRLYHLPIELNREVAGIVSANVRDYRSLVTGDDESRRATISYFLGSDFRGKGVMESALNGFVPFIFDELDANKIDAVCLYNNLPSQRVLEKAGLEKVAEMISREPPLTGKRIAVYETSSCKFYPSARRNVSDKKGISSAIQKIHLS